MKHILVVILFMFTVNFTMTGQKGTSPVSWDFKIEKVNANDYKLMATATIAPSWVLYSQFTDPEGPVPTSFMVNGKSAQLKEDGELIKEMDKLFEVVVKKFKHKTVFSTTIQKGNNNSVKGSVEFMTCDGLKCLPPTTVPFDLKF